MGTMPTIHRPPSPIGLFLVVVLAALFGAFASAPKAHAQPAPRPTAATASAAGMQRLEVGVAAARTGRYVEAAAAFEEAYALLGDVELSYNVGAMRERAGDTASAVRAYDRFLAAAPPESIAPELRAHVESIRASIAPTVTPAEAIPPFLAPIASTLPDEASATVRAPRSSVPPVAVTPSRVGPIVLLGTGGAALLAAGVFAGLRSAALGACEVSPNGTTARCPTAEARDTASAAPTWALGANVALGVGVAAIATGALWWALTPAHTEAPPVTVGAGPAGVVVAGRF